MNQKMIDLVEKKKIMLIMLDEIDKFCKENDIQYSLAYGTLLGAVRHKGYIPWDDDVDIMMTRENYEEFVKKFKSNRYKVMHHSNTVNYYYPFAKVTDSRTVLKEEGVSSLMDLGIYVDIFPVDFCGNDKEKAYKTIKKKQMLWSKLNTIKLMDVNKKRPIYKQSIVYILKALTKPISWKIILKKMNKNAMLYSKQKESKYSAATVVMLNKSEILETTMFEKTIYMPFEGHYYAAVENYDTVLRSWYGNYMILPPLKERVLPHMGKAYWKE